MGHQQEARAAVAADLPHQFELAATEKRLLCCGRTIACSTMKRLANRAEPAGGFVLLDFDCCPAKAGLDWRRS
jgi:hypothetical protein